MCFYRFTRRLGVRAVGVRTKEPQYLSCFFVLFFFCRRKPAFLCSLLAPLSVSRRGFMNSLNPIQTLHCVCPPPLSLSLSLQKNVKCEVVKLIDISGTVCGNHPENQTPPDTIVTHGVPGIGHYRKTLFFLFFFLLPQPRPVSFLLSSLLLSK